MTFDKKYSITDWQTQIYTQAYANIILYNIIIRWHIM